MARNLRRQICQAVEAAIDEGSPVTVAAIASRLGRSRFELARTLREREAVSPREVIRNQRLTCAKRLIVETTLPPKTVAYRCGFRSFAAFARQFREAFGASPSQVRERAHKLRALRD